MGQRRKGTFHRASSYLLPQLVHRSVESDADGQDCGDEGESEVESEESSESEMLNLEVCLPPVPSPARSLLQASGPATQAAMSRA